MNESTTQTEETRDGRPEKNGTEVNDAASAALQDADLSAMPVTARFAVLAALNHMGGKDISGPDLRDMVTTMTNNEVVLSTGNFTTVIRWLKADKLISTRKDPSPEKVQGGKKQLHTILPAGYAWLTKAFRISAALLKEPLPPELIQRMQEQAFAVALREASEEESMKPSAGAVALLYTLSKITGRPAEEYLLERIIEESKAKNQGGTNE
jgi:DNA-binding PadR family transcriptional regulator